MEHCDDIVLHQWRKFPDDIYVVSHHVRLYQFKCYIK